MAWACLQMLVQERMTDGHCICCAGSRSSHQGALSAGLSALAQPFKLRMARSPHETRLWDYSTNVVLIEPLASLQAVEDFLWPRVFRSNPPPEARGIGTPPLPRSLPLRQLRLLASRLAAVGASPGGLTSRYKATSRLLL